MQEQGPQAVDQSPPPLPQGPPPPRTPTKSPADEALDRDGPVIPAELLPPDQLDYSKIKPVVEQLSQGPPGATESPQQHVIDMASGVLHQGAPPPGVPPPPPRTPEQIAFEESLKGNVNLEVNVLNVCYGAVRNFVQMRQRIEPIDSAEAGNLMHGPGLRTPLEQAEPQMALEVYRQVRASMREDARLRERSELEAAAGKVAVARLLGGR